MPPQLASTLQHIVGQLDVLTQVWVGACTCVCVCVDVRVGGRVHVGDAGWVYVGVCVHVTMHVCVC